MCRCGFPKKGRGGLLICALYRHIPVNLKFLALPSPAFLYFHSMHLRRSMNILKGLGAILFFIQSGLTFGQPPPKDRIIHLDTVVNRLISAERIERLNRAYN